MKILILNKYSRLGASSRLRTKQYIPTLIERGFQIECQELFDDAYIQALYQKKSRLVLALKGYWVRLLFLLKRPSCDVLWIEKELFPWFPFWVEALLLRWIGKPFVLDYDDAIFHSYDHSPKKLVRWLLGSKHLQLLRRSALVFAGNHYLSQYAWAAGAKDVQIVPTVVAKATYTIADSSPLSPPIIGWIGSPSTVKYLDFLRPILAELRKDLSFRFRVIGATVDWPDVSTECVPWGENTEVQNLSEISIGVMPLQDTIWEQGKCGYKIIQYMACSKPIVASAIGANNQIVTDKETGFLAKSKEAWARALRTLISDAALRQSMGVSARKRFEIHYSLEETAIIVAEGLKRAGSNRAYFSS